MAPRRNGRNPTLADALATLIQNQAVLVQNQAKFVGDMAEIRKDFELIRKDFEQIKAILIRHEQLLTNLPEAIREKIGFKGR